MQILILTNGQYLQNFVLSFDKDLIGKDHSSLDFHHPIKNYPQQIPDSSLTEGRFPLPCNAIWKTLVRDVESEY